MADAGLNGRRLLAFGGGAVLIALGAFALVRALRQPAKPLPGEFLPRPAAFITDINKSEDAYDVVNPSIKGAFIKGLKGRDWGMVAGSLAGDFRARWPRPGDGQALPDAMMVLREYRETAWAETDAGGFVAILKEHVDGWSAVERTTWRPFEFLMDTGGLSAYASVHFQVAGVRPDGTRADLTGIVRAGMVSADGKAWKLRRLEWVEGARGEAKHRPWRDVTEACGLVLPGSDESRKVRAQLISERGVGTLGGLSVCDWNGDGFVDVVATRAREEMTMFLNDGRGGFVLVEPPTRAAQEIGYTPLLVDLDNDGREELITGSVLAYEDQVAYVGIHVKKGDRWELLPKALAAPVGKGIRGVSVQGIIPADVDGDGDLDIFFCNYTNIESDQLRINRVVSNDGMDNWLFMNQGGLKFTEESDARGITGTHLSYVGKAWDFDADGDLDLLEGNDFGPNFLWVNDGKAHFTEAKTHIFNADSNYTMGVSIADWDNTGDWTMYISNMYSHAGNRIVPLAQDISPEMKRLGMVLAQGNQMYERKGGVWTETAVARGVNWADWAWTCAFFDADNDMDRDIYVANGYTTNTDKNAPDF